MVEARYHRPRAGRVSGGDGVAEDWAVTRPLARLMRALSFVALLGGATAASAQELEPRNYTNLPVGLNFLFVSYAYQTGDVATDPASPLEDAELSIHSPLLGYARSFDLLGKSAKFDVLTSYGFLSGTARVNDEPARRDVSGFWDPRIRVSVNLVGAPALSPRELASYRQDWVLGVSLQVGVPLGQYDADRLVNLGTHRWTFKPEVGVSKLIDRWTLELAAGATFFTDNDEYFGGVTREQDPLYSVQGHVIYNFPSRMWLAVNGTYFGGGAASIDGGEKVDRLSSSRVGVTYSFSIDSRNSFKLFVHHGVSARVGTAFDAYGAAWQYRWGAGMP